MPGGDGMGPRGMGPMTGRAMGFCVGYAPLRPGAGTGVGLAWGRGGGRGWRNRFYATGVPGWAAYEGYSAGYAKPDPAWEKQSLRDQAQSLKVELETIERRLAELEV